jgi:hypothetical protein
LPPAVKYGWGDLRVCPQHAEGTLMAVSVFVVLPDEERVAAGLPPGHELMATRIGAERYPISVGGRRISLPMSHAELVPALGPPGGQRKDY